MTRNDRGDIAGAAPAARAGSDDARTGLALSGGGFRATLFHIGGLWRLNDSGLLVRLGEVTAVSGGSITAAWLGAVWPELSFDETGRAIEFAERVADPLRALCSRAIDAGTILRGLLNPAKRPSDYLTRAYEQGLFGARTLQDLPASGEGPRITLYATNLRTGVSVRLSRPYLGDYRLGLVDAPPLGLARAVAASSAFPPLYVPVVVKLDPALWREVQGADLYRRRSLRETLYLGDGGIYDNLGLERIWNRCGTVLVSDAGAPLAVTESAFWLRWSQLARAKRTLDISVEQNRALRKRKLIEDFASGARRGAYWGIATEVADYGLATQGLPGPLAADSSATRALAAVRTRLNAFSEAEQGRLVNWGYVLADAALRRHCLPAGAAPGRLPVPEHPL